MKIEELKEELLKQIDRNDEKSMIDTLKKLLEYPVDAETLKKTELGITVNKLKKNSSVEIRSLCKKIIDEWKKAVLKSKDESTKKPSSPVKTDKKRKLVIDEEETPIKVSTTSTATIPRTLDSPLTPKSIIEEYKSDPVVTLERIHKTGDATRDKCADMIFQALNIDNICKKVVLDITQMMK
jgi:transcription elongation factor S-II